MKITQQLTVLMSKHNIFNGHLWGPIKSLPLFQQKIPLYSHSSSTMHILLVVTLSHNLPFVSVRAWWFHWHNKFKNQLIESNELLVTMNEVVGLCETNNNLQINQILAYKNVGVAMQIGFGSRAGLRPSNYKILTNSNCLTICCKKMYGSKTGLK